MAFVSRHDNWEPPSRCAQTWWSCHTSNDIYQEVSEKASFAYPLSTFPPTHSDGAALLVVMHIWGLGLEGGCGEGGRT